MESEAARMLAAIAVGWAVTFALRLVPFVLFAGSGNSAPKWAERFGDFASPIIIAALIVYSYTGLEWRTVWPYVAGVLTVAFQLWRRNPLLSILAGTAFYMTALTCGCTTERTIELDVRHPVVTIAPEGVYFANRRVRPQEVPRILDDYGVPRSQTIHIRVDPRLRSSPEPNFLMACLAKNGYTRPILVSDRHAVSETMGPAPRPVETWSRDDTPDPPPRRGTRTGKHR